MVKRILRYSFVLFIALLFLALLSQANDESVCDICSSVDYAMVTTSGVVTNIGATGYYANFDLEDNGCHVHVYWRFPGVSPGWLLDETYVEVRGQYRKSHPRHSWEPEILANTVVEQIAEPLSVPVEPDPWTVTPWGAAGEVAGSCYQVRASDSSILIDCGSFMNTDDMPASQRGSVLDCDTFPFDPTSLHALIVTHAHDDHVGRIHYLIAQGFNGDIHMTEATRAIYLAKLDDTVSYSCLSKEWKGETELQIKESIRTHRYLEPFFVSEGVTAMFVDAAHIPGSASIILDLKTEQGVSTLCFSGDIGSGHHPFLRPIDLDTLSKSAASTLVIESTYGASDEREYPEDIYREFFNLVRDAKRHGQLVVIPTFALDRTQRVLAALLQGIRDNRLPDTLEIGVGGKSSCYLTQTYIDLCSDTAGCNEYFSDLYCASDIFLDYHDNWKFIRQPCTDFRDEKTVDPWDYDVIVTPSGTGSSSYAKKLIERFEGDPKVLFIKVGWVSSWTPMGKPENASQFVSVQDIFSGHADIRGLLNYVHAFKHLDRVIITHGDDKMYARTKLAARIKAMDPSLEIVIPSCGEHIPINE